MVGGDHEDELKLAQEVVCVHCVLKVATLFVHTLLTRGASVSVTSNHFEPRWWLPRRRDGGLTFAATRVDLFAS